MSQAFESAAKWLRQFGDTAFQVPEGAWKIDGTWYSGMAIKPAEFTEELAKLQISLRQRATTAQPVRRNQLS